MKPLILSFFLVILAYSLFFDKEEKQKVNEPYPAVIQSIHMNTGDSIQPVDTLVFFADKYRVDINL